MDIQVETLAELPADVLVAALPDFLAGHIVHEQARSAAADAARACTQGWSEADAVSVRDHIVALGQDIAVYPAHPLLPSLSRRWMQVLFTGVRVEGLEHLDAARDAGPVVIIGNHLSYVDTQATDAALAAVGRADLADRLVTVAGPKVYASLFRRFAAGCLSTLPVPQSGAVSDTDLPPRELARRAIQSLKLGHSLCEAGDVLQIYPEGTRTRTGRMGPFLKGVHRYVNQPGCRIVPMAHVGTDAMYPLGADELHPAPYEIRYPAADRGG